MARRGLLGTALGEWLGGRPDTNPAAGAELDEDTGMYFDKKGNDVTDEAQRWGTGAVKRPGAAMRIFNPNGAAQADELNLKYNTNPAFQQQDFDIQKGQAGTIARSAIAYARGVPESQVKDDEVNGVVGATGLSARQGGVSPDRFNSYVKAIQEGKMGVPTTQARTNAAQSESAYDEEKAYQDAGGPTTAGLARASTVKLAGRRANSGLTLEPMQTQLEGSRLTGALGREGVVESAMDQEAVNRLADATDIQPAMIQKASYDAKAALGRAPTENEVLDYALKNRLNLQQNITPVEYSNELDKLKTVQAASPLIKQTIMNNAQQALAASTQPPAEMMRSSVLFHPAANFNINNPATMFQRNPGRNPTFVPSMQNQWTGGQMMMQQMGQGGQGGAGLVALPSGGFISTSAVPPQLQPSAPATATIRRAPAAQVWNDVQP